MKPVIDRPVIVEGKYDKIKLSSIFDGVFITTEGFGIFKNKEKRELIRTLSAEKGIIIAADSDGAGQVIRGYLKGIVEPDKAVCVYIPCVKGKEKRKKSPSAEGFLGVEGTDADVLRALFSPYTAEGKTDRATLTVADMYELGLSGKENSAELRRRLLAKLGLPQTLSSSSVREALAFLYTKEQIAAAVNELKGETSE